MAEQTVRMVEMAEEALSPREARLERAGRVLQWGAIANAVLAVLAMLAAFAGGVKLVPDLFPTLHNLLLTQLNISALLVVMVGVLAREIWALVGVWVIVIVNILGLILLGFTPAVVTILFAVWSGAILAGDLRAFRINPVMLKELRGRMRGVRAFVVLTVYLGLMSGFTALLYLVYTPVNRSTGSAAAGEVGRVLFMGVVGIELMLIIFIAPAFTAGAITGERERQTYDLLRTTLLATSSFVIGKLESALSYVLLLLLAAIPLQSIAFLFGGVSELELILAFVLLTVTGITLGTVGIFFSAIAPRTLTASVRAYTSTLVATFIAPLVLTIVVNFLSSALRTTSPIVESILIYVRDFLTSLNPIATALTTQQLLIDKQVLGFFTDTLATDGSTIPRVSPWITFTIIYLVVATILIVLSVRRMRKLEG
jgi:hypothetical protein